jgi:hypothetical protein
MTAFRRLYQTIRVDGLAHAPDEWERQSVEYHARHAADHLQCWLDLYDGGLLDHALEDHLAHALARIIFAMELEAQ